MPAFEPPVPKPLRNVQLPLVHPDDVPVLSGHGWTKMHSFDDDAFSRAFTDLLDASEAFFNLPLAEKQKYQHPAQGSELGYSRVEGEKELITLRSLRDTPDMFKDAAQRYWSICAQFLNSMLECIAYSLGLPTDAFTCYSKPCSSLQEDKTATMVRLFRYDNDEAFKVVAEPHSDLGLLSLVAGDTPGLEVWERVSQSFYPIEREFPEPATAVLCGTQLARLTNFRYIPGGHRVVAYPDSAVNLPTRRHPNHRFSIVFILRAHYPVPIDTDKLTTPITGPFKQPMHGITARDLFNQISASHWNINIDKNKREEQKRKLDAARKKQPGTG